MARRKRTPEIEEPIGLDGWIKLRGGGMFALAVDTEPSPSIPELQDAMRRVRGWFLGHGFDVEDGLVTLILATEFGTVDPAIGGDAFRAKATKLRRDPNLMRKIDEARPIIRTSVEKSTADPLIQDLAEYRRIRHLMAHRPCWLEGAWDPEAGTLAGMPKGRTVAFRLFTADEDFVWEIDDAQSKEWGELLDRCKAGLAAIRQLKLPPPPENTPQ